MISSLWDEKALGGMPELVDTCLYYGKYSTAICRYRASVSMLYEVNCYENVQVCLTWLLTCHRLHVYTPFAQRRRQILGQHFVIISISKINCPSRFSYLSQPPNNAQPHSYPFMTGQNARLSPALTETLAGLSAGAASTLAVHPLDVIKTRLQSMFAPAQI